MPAAAIAFDRSARSIDADGRLHVARTHISKANVRPYYGREIPGCEQLGLDRDRVYKLLLDPKELQRAAPTFARLPILSEHVPVTVDFPRADLVVGTIGSDVQFSGPYLDADLCVWDSAAIAGIETRDVVQLSIAYRYVPVMEPGTHEGEAFDGRMTQIRGNHLALVEVGRAGPDVVVADGWNEGDHPRDGTGKFTSGAGGGSGEAQSKIAANEYDHISPDDQYAMRVRQLEEEGLDTSDAQSAADVEVMQGKHKDWKFTKEDLALFGLDSSPTINKRKVPAMKMTKLGRAMHLAICGMSAALAADSATQALFSEVKKEGFDRKAITDKLVALDAKLNTEAVGLVFDSMLDLETNPDPQTPVGDSDPDDEEDDEEDKAAMDAAIAAAVTTATDALRKQLLDAQTAAREVENVVGEVQGMDSAEAIYGFALDHLKIDHKAVNGAEAKAALFRVAASRTTSANDDQIAADAAASADINKQFPHLARFRRA